jgi:hypothetical protein
VVSVLVFPDARGCDWTGVSDLFHSRYDRSYRSRSTTGQSHPLLLNQVVAVDQASGSYRRQRAVRPLQENLIIKFQGHRPQDELLLAQQVQAQPFWSDVAHGMTFFALGSWTTAEAISSFLPLVSPRFAIFELIKVVFAISPRAFIAPSMFIILSGRFMTLP